MSADSPKLTAQPSGMYPETVWEAFDLAFGAYVARFYGPDAEANARKFVACDQLVAVLGAAYKLLRTMTTEEYQRGADRGVRSQIELALAAAKGSHET